MGLTRKSRVKMIFLYTIFRKNGDDENLGYSSQFMKVIIVSNWLESIQPRPYISW